MLRMRDYTPELRDRIAAVAERAGVRLRRRLRLGLATDGLIALKAGYPSAAIGSVTKYKLPLNYHSQRDTADALVYETVRDAACCARRSCARRPRSRGERQRRRVGAGGRWRPLASAPAQHAALA